MLFRVAHESSSIRHNACMLLNSPTMCPLGQVPRKGAVDPRLAEVVSAGGFADLCVLLDQVCAVKRFNFTFAVVVGINAGSYQRRYCFEHQADAQAALKAWDGSKHPPGPWIKCKGAGIDLLNPALC